MSCASSLDDDDDRLLFKEQQMADELVEKIISIKHNQRSITSFEIYFPQYQSTISLQRLGDILRRNTRVKTLVIKNYSQIEQRMAALMGGLQYNQYIHTLNLRGFNLREQTQYIAPFISKNPKLVDLNLSGCNIRQSGIILLSNAIMDRSKDSICKVNLSENGLGSMGIEVLISAVVKCNHLKELYLDDNEIGTRGCNSLANLLKRRGSKLETLSLYDNSIDNEGVIALSQSLKKNSTLKCLGLRGNKKITMPGWLSILRLVCDTSSIKSIKASNHTVDNIGMFRSNDDSRHLRIVASMGADYTNLLRSSLELNAKSNKSKVVCQKIIFAHAREDLNIGRCSIQREAMPNVLSYFGDDTNASLIQYDHPPLSPAMVDTIRLESIYNMLLARPDLVGKAAPDPDDTLYICFVVVGLLLSIVFSSSFVQTKLDWFV